MAEQSREFLDRLSSIGASLDEEVVRLGVPAAGSRAGLRSSKRE